MALAEYDPTDEEDDTEDDGTDYVIPGLAGSQLDGLQSKARDELAAGLGKTNLEAAPSQVKAATESARKPYDDYAAKIAAARRPMSRFDRTLELLAAYGKPSHGTGEALSNVAQTAVEQKRRMRELEDKYVTDDANVGLQRDQAGLKAGTEMGALESRERIADKQIAGRAAALQAKYGAGGAGGAASKVETIKDDRGNLITVFSYKGDATTGPYTKYVDSSGKQWSTGGPPTQAGVNGAGAAPGRAGGALPIPGAPQAALPAPTPSAPTTPALAAPVVPTAPPAAPPPSNNTGWRPAGLPADAYPGSDGKWYVPTASGAPKEVMDASPEFVANSEALKAATKLTAEERAKAQIAVPALLSTADRSLADITDLLNQKGFNGLFGLPDVSQGGWFTADDKDAQTGKVTPRRMALPGSPVRDAEVVMRRVKGGAFVNAFVNTFKGSGAGAFSNIEGEKTTDSFVNLDPTQSEAQGRRGLLQYAANNIRLARNSQVLSGGKPDFRLPPRSLAGVKPNEVFVNKAGKAFYTRRATSADVAKNKGLKIGQMIYDRVD